MTRRGRSRASYRAGRFRVRTIQVLLLAAVSLLWAQEPPAGPGGGRGGANQDPMSAATFAGFRLRAIGPALMSGRVNHIAVDPRNKSVWYVGVASGGVWKTTNAGITFTPVFQNEGTYSIGAVVLDPNNPNTVWVGTGENNNQRSVGWGDGVYRSDDGGRTWRNVGLKQSGNIGRIAIDPRNSNIVYVAAMGWLWGPGGDRGLYRSADGGRTWDKVLNISENTGVVDVALDPNNPDIVLAAAHQRRRHVWTMIHGGPESGLHRSVDGGKTFTRIRSGLPAGETGRIGFAFAPKQKGLVYALVEASQGSGTYCSTDSGVNWEFRSSYTPQAMYYQRLEVDPSRPETIYSGDVSVQVSDDGGRNWRAAGQRSMHADVHVIWTDPDNSDHLLSGTDGGLYESYDRAATWRHFTNLSVTQFYNVTVDNASPIYNVYGGTQDNSTLGGPSRTKGTMGAQNADWIIVTGGDGFVSRVDPTDPDIVYGESQYGVLVRMNRKTGERVGIKPVEGKGEPALRFNWETPYIISPHSPTRLYYGANKLFRSDDRGNNWKAISGDLTRQIDRNLLPVMGRIWPPEAIAKHQSTTTYGTITALSESPKKDGLIYVGTDDGEISITENAGGTWRKVEKIAGLPETKPYGVFVQRLYASKHDVNTVFALFDNHKNLDFKPYLMKSTDKGVTWASISGDLPDNGPVLSLAEDHVDPNLLFAGTEFGLYFTNDGGKKWIRLRGNLPTIPVRDMVIQERENDLVIATFGRGFYILDDYAPLRSIKLETFNKPAEILPIKKSTIFVQETGKSRGSQGEQLWFAENPPYGAVITYWLKDTLQTKRQQRLASGRAGARQGQPAEAAPSYPSQEQLTAEADEDPPQVVLTITDSAGRFVRRLSGPAQRGMQRVVWDFRGMGAATGAGGGFAGGGGGQRGGAGAARAGAAAAQFIAPPGGAAVLPGTYKVSLSTLVNGVSTPLGAERTFVVDADPALLPKPADLKLMTEFQQKARRLQMAMSGTTELATNLRTRLAAVERALLDSPADLKLLAEAKALNVRLTAVRRKLTGDETLRGLESGSPTTLQGRVSSAATATRGVLSVPTGTQQMNYQIAVEELAQEQAKLKQIDAELKKIEAQMDALGVAYTPGRLPDVR